MISASASRAASVKTGTSLLLLLAACLGCVTADRRTPADIARDEETWRRAAQIRITLNPDQLKGCASLGIVSEGYGEGLPSPQQNRSIPGGTWEEGFLRFKTAQLGGNAALLSEVKVQAYPKVIGEAYRCEER